MSNFQCPHCGMINVDCGKDGYKTPREIELECKVKKLTEEIGSMRLGESDIPHLYGKSFEEIRDIIESEKQLKRKLAFAVDTLKEIKKRYPDKYWAYNIPTHCALIGLGEIKI